MLDFITLDIPQLPIDPIGPSSTSRDTPAELKAYFITTYLREKLPHFSARHGLINDYLRKVFLLQQERVGSGQNAFGYHLDQSHYVQLAGIEAICSNMYQSTIELLTIIHCMDHLKRHNTYPPALPSRDVYPTLIGISHIQESIDLHMSFIEAIFRIQEELHAPFVHANHDELFVDEEPMVFLPTNKDPEEPAIERISLVNLVYQYVDFFQAAKALLQRCAPESLVSFMQWN